MFSQKSLSFKRLCSSFDLIPGCKQLESRLGSRPACIFQVGRRRGEEEWLSHSRRAGQSVTKLHPDQRSLDSQAGLFPNSQQRFQDFSEEPAPGLA